MTYDPQEGLALILVIARRKLSVSDQARWWLVWYEKFEQAPV